MKSRYQLSVFAASLTVIILFGTVFSRDAHALTVTPFRIELAGDSGDTIDQTFTLYNETGRTLTYSLKFQNFEARDESGEPVFVSDNSNLASWMSAANSVTLTPRQRIDVPFRIRIPQNVEPGGYFAGVFARSGDAGKPDGGEVSVSGQLGTLVLLRVNGTISEEATVAEFNTLNKKKVFSSLPVDFYYRFQNGGQSYVKPLGDIFIKNMVGQQSKIVPVNPSGNNVLPQSIRRFEASWLESFGPDTQDVNFVRPDEPKPGFWNHVVYEFQHFALGRYSARLNLAYGNASTAVAEASTSFWVIPWHLLIIAGGVFLILLMVVVVFFGGIVLTFMKMKRKR